MNEDLAINPPYKLLKIFIGKSESFVKFQYYSKKTKKYERDKIFPHLRGASPAQIQKRLEDIYEKAEQLIKYRNKHNIYHEDVKGIKIGYDVTFLQAIEMEIEKKIPETRRSLYNALSSVLESFYQDNEFRKNSLPSDIDENYLNELISHMQENEYKGKTINNHLWAIQKISESLVKLKIISAKIETKDYRVSAPKNETKRFPPLSVAQMHLVFNYYRKWRGGKYYLYLLILHYTCIRPSEIHRLKREYFNFENRTIFVPWYGSKNGLSSYVQILEPLYNSLIEAGIDKIGEELYIFGEDFEPTAKMYQGDNSSEIWRRHRENVGIPKNLQQYGLKHTFNKMYVDNNKHNVDWEWLRRHNRHADVRQTQDYIADLTAYFLNEQNYVIVDFHSGDKL